SVGAAADVDPRHPSAVSRELEVADAEPHELPVAKPPEEREREERGRYGAGCPRHGDEPLDLLEAEDAPRGVGPCHATQLHEPQVDGLGAAGAGGIAEELGDDVEGVPARLVAGELARTPASGRPGPRELVHPRLDV